MKNYIYLLVTLLISANSFAQGLVDQETPADALPNVNSIGSEWILDFSDEFNDTTVDLKKWNIDDSEKSRNARPKLGISNWMWKAYNVWEESGNLVLQVTKHNANTMHCGSVNSHNKYETKYGYFEARIKIAQADKGTHTAFWLQGPNMGNVDGTANDGAEIDIFESAWLGDYTKSVVHIDGYGADHKANTKQYSTPGIHNGFHTYGLHWTEDFMKIYYDGQLKVTYSTDQWIVRADEFLWLSDGASFGFEGDYFTKLAEGILTAAYVDYIRVWKPIGAASSVIPNGDFIENPEEDKWLKSSNDILLYKSLSPFYSASYCMMPNADNERSILQSVSVESGMPYEFQLTGRIQNTETIRREDNKHESNGPATLKAELKVSGETILELNTQSNKDTTISKQIIIPEGVNKVLVKVSKNWNIAYIDQVVLTRIRSLGIHDKAASLLEINAYPNPCTRGQDIVIDTEVALSSYQLFAMDGRLMKSDKCINNNKMMLNTEFLERGIYLLNVNTTTGKQSTQKIIIN